MTVPSEAEVRAMLTTATESWDARVGFVTTLPAREHATAMAATYRHALALLDELAEARKDRERVDWIEAQQDVEIVNSERDQMWYVDRIGIGHSGETLRAAIDTARGA